MCVIISNTKEPLTASGIVTRKHHQYKSPVTGISDFDKFPASDKFHCVCGWGIYHSKRREQSCMIGMQPGLHCHEYCRVWFLGMGSLMMR